ncbi:helix-turn-helix transcriptional regulator [Streptomyces flaveolus]|uniref:helix-turn-helix transcriptional regulator n=1 Tax=Streptomyces flaveolus TaxID=67297 RepID=UPI0036F7EB84
MSTTELGEFLRARRELVQPEDVGLPGGGRRRVAGLRREELALLAGISTDYYLRLEQGRDRHPSSAVLDALARVLQLDEEATAYLHTLAVPEVRRTKRLLREQAPEGIRQLISTYWSGAPAIVLNRYMDVLASNQMAVALSPINSAGVNVIRAAFLEPQVRTLYRNWEEMSIRAVASLRALIGPDSRDPRVVDLVNELSLASPEFSRLWARYDVSPKGKGESHLQHPVVGELHLSYERLQIPGTGGQLLVVHHADPNTASGRKLAQLAADASHAHGQPGER